VVDRLLLFVFMLVSFGTPTILTIIIGCTLKMTAATTMAENHRRKEVSRSLMMKNEEDIVHYLVITVCASLSSSSILRDVVEDGF
jgi:hypothetical protein